MGRFFLVADLLGNILANLLGDRLALLSWLLPRNVAAVLHLLGDNIHLLEVFVVVVFLSVFVFVLVFVFLFLCSPRSGAEPACTRWTQPALQPDQ